MTAAGNFLYTPDAWICGRFAPDAAVAALSPPVAFLPPGAKNCVKIAGRTRVGGA